MKMFHIFHFNHQDQANSGTLALFHISTQILQVKCIDFFTAWIFFVLDGTTMVILFSGTTEA